MTRISQQSAHARPIPPFTDEHEAFRARARAFVASELAPRTPEYERDEWFPNDVFVRCAQEGYLGLKYEERYGGTDQGLKVSFDYGSHKVSSFKAKVRCTGPKAQTFKYPTVPVNRKGRFSVHQAGPSLDGKISGHSAKGTLTLPGCDAAANEVKFTAHSE